MSWVTDPLIVEIFLYKNNYKDRLLIAEMKEHARIVTAPFIESNSFFIQADELTDILYQCFRKDLADFASTSASEVSPSVTSIFFINNLLVTFPNVKYLKVNVSDSPVYSRKVENKVHFDYRIIHSKVDFGSILTEEDLSDVKSLFISAGIYKVEPFNTKPYFEIHAKDLLTIISSYGLNLEDGDEDHQLIGGIKALLGPKIEQDNPTLLIIIDK